MGFTFHGTYTEGQRGEQWGRDGSDESASCAPEELFVLDHRPPISSGESRAGGESLRLVLFICDKSGLSTLM